MNDLTRQDAQHIASALAQLLWQRRPWRGRVATAPTPTAPVQRAPLVVVAFDERPFSPDLALGALTGFRQSGCQVVEIGAVSKPIWWAISRQLNADAGLMVSGSDHDPSWTGCDFIGDDGAPFAAAEIAAILRQAREPAGRLSRSAGSVSSCSPLPVYGDQLGSHFHALRPLSVIVATSSQIVGHLLRQAFQGLPCQLQCESGVEWRATVGESAPMDERFGRLMRAGQFDLGFWIHEDGQSCRVWDENGQLVPVKRLNRWLVEATLRDRQSETENRVVFAEDLGGGVADLQRFQQTLQAGRAAAGIDHAGRFWLGGERPTCDAILTLAAILRGLSWSDTPLSRQLNAGGQPAATRP